MLAVGILLIWSYFGGRAANALKLPRVCGYLLAGMLLGPSFANVLSCQLIDEDLLIVTEIALAIISYSIGGSLSLQALKRLKRHILWITCTQTIATFLLTTSILAFAMPFLTNLNGTEHGLFDTHFPLALIIGAISIATASGAILAVIAELKASGPFTTTLLAVVALSYGLTIIFFTLAGTINQFLLSSGTTSCFTMLGSSLAEIGISLALGLVSGFALMLMCRIVRRREALLMVILGALLCTGGLAKILDLSPLLANMALGATIANLETRHREYFLVLEQIEEPLFGLFFGLAGAHIDIAIFKSAGLLTMAIVVVRMCAKQLGTWGGALISQAPKTIEKYLGVALSPQAGWTVGLVILAREATILPDVFNILLNAVVGSVIISQLIGLPLVKYALIKAGETVGQKRPGRSATGPT
jgi:Kef-type K+ transport system membrane component KefB